MRVTFLDHSGFLVELEESALLFDWWKGDLPPLPDKPLIVFASHFHADHFSPAIFDLDDGKRSVHFLLGRGIRPKCPEETKAKCTILRPGESVAPVPGICVETLPSTDDGVAFVVTAGDKTVFHAGDLNWWHWEGEDYAWNRNMEANFKRYCEPLRRRRLDLALLALDPRQNQDAYRGIGYFLELADIRRCIPMHQWDQFSFTQDFLAAFPQYANTILPVERSGQVWEL